MQRKKYRTLPHFEQLGGNLQRGSFFVREPQAVCLRRIAVFTCDALVKYQLRLVKGINADAISGILKKLGQCGARRLEKLLLRRHSLWPEKSGLKQITLDADSTVSLVCGNQEGAAKGYSDKKKGAKSYHPLLVFVSEIKLLYHSWFRTGAAYTSNGIVEFLKQVRASLPGSVEKVFFRADSGFFSGKLLDYLEKMGWDYLIKVCLQLTHLAKISHKPLLCS